MPRSVEPAVRMKGIPAGCSGIVQFSVKVMSPFSSCEGMFASVSESSGIVAVAPPAKSGAVAAFSTLYVLANVTGQSNVTVAPVVVTIFVTTSADVPATVTGASFSKRTVSADVGAAVASAPPTSQLPAVAQSPLVPPFHT